MADRPEHRSALAHLQLSDRATPPSDRAGVHLTEHPLRDQLTVRGDAASGAFRRAMERTLGAPLPLEPNTVSVRGEKLILWLGPDEWLAVMPAGDAPAAMGKLRRALGSARLAVTDTSDGRAVIGLAGDHARDTLMKGTSIDLHPRAFGAGRSAQTRIARCQVLIHQRDDAPEYDLYVARSFADYAWRWLEDAGREYGVAIATGG